MRGFPRVKFHPESYSGFPFNPFFPQLLIFSFYDLTSANVMKQRKLSKVGLEKDNLLAQMPTWLDKANCKIYCGAADVQMTFHCRCSTTAAKTIQRKIYVGKKVGVERARHIGALIAKEHNDCWAAPAPLKTAQEMFEHSNSEIERLEKALSVQRARAEEFEADNGLLKRKLEQTVDIRTANSQRKRQTTNAVLRQAEIDSSNQEPWGENMASYTMTATSKDKPSGIVQTMEYWCEGSQLKALDLVMSMLKRWKLQELVAARIGATCDKTNAYIVARAKAAMQQLKHYRS